jgi:hypothetical protein
MTHLRGSNVPAYVRVRTKDANGQNDWSQRRISAVQRGPKPASNVQELSLSVIGTPYGCNVLCRFRLGGVRIGTAVGAVVTLGATQAAWTTDAPLTARSGCGAVGVSVAAAATAATGAQ